MSAARSSAAITRAETSSAVMAKRHEAADSLDFFPTPAWATRALCEWLLMQLTPRAYLRWPLHLSTAWEPACGQGDMARPLTEYFTSVFASDVPDWGAPSHDPDWRPDEIGDFTLGAAGPGDPPDWIITNPPFNLAEAFVLHALKRATRGVANLIRTQFLEGTGRAARLFGPHRPAAILQFAERLNIVKDRLDPRASRPTAYCWIVWDTSGRVPDGTRFDWIAPCRAEFDRPGDWPAAPVSDMADAPLFAEGA